MNCEMTDSRWTDYLDQALPARERREIESHLSVCAHCRSEMEMLRQVDQRLRIEFGIACAALPVPPVGAGPQERLLNILREEVGVPGPKRMQLRLWKVRWVLALLCGPNTATRIIEAAESHSKVSVNARPSEQAWLAFLRRLAFLTTEICGSYAGELIWSVGN